MGETDQWEFTKEYPPGHVQALLLSWFRQSQSELARSVAVARRGCVLLPDPGASCFSKSKNQPLARGYGLKQRQAMLDRMVRYFLPPSPLFSSFPLSLNLDPKFLLVMDQETAPERSWPKASEESIWEFKQNRGLLGSPMFDAVSKSKPVNLEMMTWLRERKITFEGPYDTK